MSQFKFKISTTLFEDKSAIAWAKILCLKL